MEGLQAVLLLVLFDLLGEFLRELLRFYDLFWGYFLGEPALVAIESERWR